MASRRQLRGFDAALLRSALEQLPLRVLRCALRSEDLAVGGSKSDVVDRLHSEVIAGRLAFRQVFEVARKAHLKSTCTAFDIDARGLKSDLLARLERAVRLKPLGNIARLPHGFEESLDPRLSAKESLLVLELHARLLARNEPVTRVSLAELVRRLGRHRAERRLRREAAEHLGAFLRGQGFTTSPDLCSLSSSPGRDAVVELRLHVASDEPSEPPPPSRPEPRTEDGETVLALGVANADNHQHPKEMEVIRRRIGGQPEVLHPLLDRLHTDARTLEDAASRIGKSKTIEERLGLFRHLADVAWADGVLVASEATLLRTIGSALQLHRRDVEAALEPPAQETATSPAVADVSEDLVREATHSYVAADRHVDEILEILFA